MINCVKLGHLEVILMEYVAIKVTNSLMSSLNLSSNLHKVKFGKGFWHIWPKNLYGTNN